MGTNFNVGSFNAINTSEVEDKKPSNNFHGTGDDLKKKLLIFGGIIIVGVILIAVILVLFSKKTYSYDDVEKIMTSAAENYFEDHPKRLPTTESQRVEIDVDTLVASEYMKEMVTYTGEELSCSGKVTVQTNGDDYLYIPRLDCGENYITQSLKEVVTNKVVTDGYGLYEVGDSYVYRGESVDNYLKLDNALWRIVKVTSKGQFMLILDDDISESVPWDDRYNSQVGYNVGINTFSASRIKDSILENYNSKEEDEIILSDDDRSKTVAFDLCTGKRSVSDTSKDNSVECSEVLENQKVGLLTASDFMMGSIDPNCKTVVDYSCQNYNYLATSYKWWLITAVKDNTKEAYGIDSSGVAAPTTTSSYMYPRIVIMLDSNVLFKNGKGTESNPYKIK